jgi:hypothetical protein
MEEKMDEKLKDLNLLMMYLTGWEEDSRKNPGEKIYRSWKGYLFDVLNELEEDNMIFQIKNGKSVILLKKGVERAKRIKSQYFK